MENDDTSDIESETNAGDSSNANMKQSLNSDKHESRQINISLKKEQVEHILSDTNCLKERKNNKKYSKQFKCDKCDNRYTWYSGLSNHKRFVHNKLKET